MLSVLFCRAQNTTFTYQGRIRSGNTDFNGIGQFKFALVTSSNANRTATATANPPSGGFITGYTVTHGGNGYVTAPAVTVFGGGGSGAAAHANISGGVVTNLSVDNPGNGNYTNAPTVLLAPPPPNLSYTTYWSNDGTSVDGSAPTASVAANVSNGLFAVVLGDATLPNMAAIPATIFAQPNLQLRIWFNDGVNGFAALEPAQNLTPAPYAVNASMASGLTGLSVQSNTNGAPNIVGGSPINFISNAIGATIAGGGATDYIGTSFSNAVTVDFGTVSGGLGNTIKGNGWGGVVAGGLRNTVSGAGAVVGGGFDNAASNELATVSGGGRNTARGRYATVAGGYLNVASAENAAVGGGAFNIASGYAATVGGGYDNVAGSSYSFAAGVSARALHHGSFVWNSGNSAFDSTADYQFSVRASGGIRLAGNVELSTDTYRYLSLSGGNAHGYLYGSYPAFGDGIHLGYNYYADANNVGHVFNPGGATSRITAGYGEIRLAVGGVNAAPTTTMLYIGTGGVCANGPIGSCSDRNVKQNLAPVSPAAILEKVIQLPVSQWSYTNNPAVRHVGPMAQDFYSAFNVGPDDKQIATVDADGVALAAIQGLNEKLEHAKQKTESEIKELKAENEELRKQVKEIKAALVKLAIDD
jgi:hypothetical protein